MRTLFEFCLDRCHQYHMMQSVKFFFFLLLKVVSLKMVIKVKTHALSCSGTMNEFHSGCCGERKKKKDALKGVLA